MPTKGRRSIVVRLAVCAFAVPLVAGLFTPGCGTGRPDPGGGGDAGVGGRISGTVLLGRAVKGGTVEVHRLSPTGAREALVASSAIGDDGTYAVELGASEGPFLLVARGGSYVDPATGVTVPLEQGELRALVPLFEPGDQHAGILLTPLSHLAATLAPRWLTPSVDLATAHADAKARLFNHFGALDWETVVPGDLASQPAVASEATRAALLVTGLCEAANTLSLRAQRPGGVTCLRLLHALEADLAFDGYFDGLAASALVLPEDVPVRDDPPSGTALGGDTVRFALAKAIDAYLSSTRNVSSLRPSDVRDLLDALSRASDPRLFRTGGQGGYDAEPPAVSFKVQYALPGDVTPRDPVGAQRLVGGEVTVTAEATDASTMKSLAVLVAGAPLRAAAQGNTASRYVGAWTTSGSGPLTFTARAEDVHGNASETAYTVGVDNGAPVITVTAPLQDAFYASQVAVTATAADSSGVAAFAATAPTGLVDLDGTTEGLTATWSVPVELGDGVAAVTLRACDVVGHCAQAVRSFRLDRTAPSVFFEALPEYTNQAAVTLAIEAQDTGAGITTVWVRHGTTAQKATFNAETGKYTAALTLSTGTNTVSAWAIDAAGNSGEGGSFPLEQTGATLLDTGAPLVSNITAQGIGYRPEEALTLIGDGVPAQLGGYGQAFHPRFDSSVHKAAPLLGWQGVTPSAAELETSNGSNTPYLTFRVPFDGAAEAPLVGASYEIRCTTCSTVENVATGTLWSTTSSDGRYRHWSLPLNAETVPFLKRLTTASVPLAIKVTATDAAGNSGNLEGQVTFNVTAPPVRWTQDLPSTEDPQGVYAYRAANAKYTQLFDPAQTVFAPSGGARVLRFRVANPFPVPVAVSVATGGTAAWTFNESEANAPSATPSGSFREFWEASACRPLNPSPCANTSTLARRLYDGTSDFCTSSAATLTAPINPRAATTTGWTLAGFLDFNSAGNEQQLAPPYNAGGARFFRVPAATGSTPGSVTVYVVIPRERPGRPPLMWNAGANRFEYLYGDYWQYANVADVACPEFGVTKVQRWNNYKWWRYLTAISFAGSGSYGIQTHSVVDDGASYPLLGTPRAFASGSYAINQSL